MITLSRFKLALALVAAAAVSANAETLLMPKRDALRNQFIVIWGVTTLPSGSSIAKFDFNNDGLIDHTTVVADRSYIPVSFAFPTAGTFTVKMTVENGALSESATVEVRVVDPAAFATPGTSSGPVGPGSKEIYRNVRINMAIQDGLRYLWTAQTNRSANFPAGTQTSWQGHPQWSAFVVAAFENHGYRLPNSNTPPTGLYEKYIVQRGLNFVVANLDPITIGSQASGFGGQPVRDPCNGTGIEPSPCQGLTETNDSQGYTIGIAMLPLAASSALSRNNGAFGPPAASGKTYGEILQRLANTYAWGQIDQNTPHRGGWGYHLNTGTLDSSTMGWGILGMLDAQANGLVVPPWVKTELAFGITGAWNTNGSFDYNADGNPGSHVYSNMERAGIAMQAMFMAGEIGGPRVGATRTYISDRWNVSGRLAPDNAYWGNCGGFPTNFGCSYSMFNNFKALKLQNIATLPGVGRLAGPGALPANDWHASYIDWFVNNQQFPTSTAGGWWNMAFSNFGNATEANVAIAELILADVALILPDADLFSTIGLSPAYFAAVEGGTHTVTALALSSSKAPVAGATVNFEILSGPNAGLTGIATTNAAGQAQFTYTDAGPIPSFGIDNIQARIGTLLSNIVQMEWLPFNRPPVANPDTFSVPEDNFLTGNVLANDTDPDAGDVITAALVTGPAHGTLVLNANGSFTYTPLPNYCGPDSFTYDVNDGEVDGNVAAVAIDVTCVNDAPVANPDSFTVAEDTPLTGGSLLTNDADVDAGETLTAVLVTGPAHGTLVLNSDGTFSYTPAANYCGPDGFTYRAHDGEAASNVASVTIDVTCVNDAPVANPDSFTVAEDAVLTGGNVLTNDADADAGDTLTALLVSGPAHGTLVLNSDGTFTYTPAPNYCGPDGFTYRARDGQVDGNVASVTIDVTCANDAPIAADSSVTTAEDTPVTGAVTSTDGDGPSATYAVVSAPSHGTLVLDPATGAYTYTPALNYTGPDSFTFSVADGAGGTDTGVVSITVTAVNDAPVCTAAAPSIASLWPADHSLVNINVLGVVDPVEGSAITITIDGIFQDEPTETTGDGNTLIDGYGVGTPVAQIRRERSGSKRVPGDGRMYYINFTATDAEGGTCTGTVQVGVPHDMGQDHVIGAGGPIYSSTGQ